MNDSISKTALLGWLLDQLAEVKKATTAHANSYRHGMSGKEALAYIQEETRLAVRADMLQDAITLIEQYEPETPTPADKVEFSQFVKVFEEWAEAHRRVVNAEKQLGGLDNAENSKFGANYETRQKSIQHRKNIACMLAYRLSVLYPAVSQDIACTVTQMGKYAVSIEPVIDPFTKKSSLRVHWMKWEGGKDLPVHGFMEQADFTTIE